MRQTLEYQVTHLVEQVVGWPSPGTRFSDVSRILERHPDVFLALVDRLCDHYRQSPPEVIMPIEARGFIYGGAMAARLGCRVVLARKGPRLPRAVVAQDFGSGYERGLVIGAHEDAIDVGDAVLVVDDVLAAGWTAVGAARLVAKMGARCIGVAVAIELGHLAGRKNLAGWTDAPLFAAVTTLNSEAAPAP